MEYFTGFTMIETSLSFFFLLIMTSGGLGAKWSVTYTPTDICALEGSSVTMSCSYTYPWGLTVTQAYWINQEYGDAVDLSQIETYRRRITVACGEKIRGCSLQMTKLTKADAQYQYSCRIITNVNEYKWIGKPGISLHVTDLKVVSSGQGAEMMEGENVTLTCDNTCPESSSPSFIWSKDGRPVEKKRSISNQLQLHPVRYEDGGSYTCAVKGHEDRPSPPLKLNVCKNVITSDREAVQEGDLVTLTCNTTCTLSSSPSFIWSKDGRPVEKKRSINNQLQLHPVRYEDGGNYTCAITAQDLPSRPFKLQVMTVDHSPVIAALVGVAVCGVVGLLCVIYWLRSCKGNKKTTDQDTQDDVDYENDPLGGRSGALKMSSVYQNLNPNTTQPDAVYQSLNPNTIQPDAVYQSLNSNTAQPDAVYQSLNPNTTQPDAVYQSLNPNTTQPDAVSQSLNPNTTQPDAVYQKLNPNTTQPDAVYQSMNPNTTQPDAVYQKLNPNTTQPDAVYQSLKTR